MKKIKSLFVVVILAAFTTSCTKEDQVSSNEVQNQNVLHFASEEEMQAKIAEIEIFRKNQEEQICQKMLLHNNVTPPKLEDFKKATKNEVTEAEKTKILEDIKFYHQLKLKAIYAERTHFGFTSIQSIADEINFSKLIDPNKSNELFENYKSLLVKNEFETKSIYTKSVSTIINKNGEFFLKDKNLASNYLKKDKISNTADKSISAGYLATGYNEFIVITYGTDVEYTSNTRLVQLQGGGTMVYTDYLFKPSTTLSCFVNSAYGYVLYPCYFNVVPNSYAIFNIGSTTVTLGFSSGYGNYTRVVANQYAYNLSNFSESVRGSVSGTFAVPVAGTSNFLWVSGSKNF